MLSRFAIDGTMGHREVANTTRAGEKKTADDTEEWCTIDELAAPHRCNGKVNAELYAEDALSRPHIRPAYARSMIKQYKWERQIKTKSQGVELPHQDILSLGVMGRGLDQSPLQIFLSLGVMGRAWSVPPSVYLIPGRDGQRD
jgi:hypothetical protein